MNIKIIKKQNVISVAGNQFQCASSSPSITASTNGDYVSVINNTTNKYVVKDALYSTIVDESGVSLGSSAFDVALSINSYAQNDNPDKAIKYNTSIGDGDLMYWKAADQEWVPSSRSNLLGDQSVGNLIDVSLINVQDEDILVYNYVNSRFENNSDLMASNEMFMIFLEQ